MLSSVYKQLFMCALNSNCVIDENIKRKLQKTLLDLPYIASTFVESRPLFERRPSPCAKARSSREKTREIKRLNRKLGAFSFPIVLQRWMRKRSPDLLHFTSENLDGSSLSNMKGIWKKRSYLN